MSQAENGSAWGSVVAGLASVATLPVAVYGTRFSDSYDLLHAGFAIPVTVVLGLVAMALARRARYAHGGVARRRRGRWRCSRRSRLGDHRPVHGCVRACGARGVRPSPVRRLAGVAVKFDPRAPAFLADPYPVLAELRETTPVLHHEELDRWFVTRHADVRACLRDKRLGRNFRHVGNHDEFKDDALDPRWAAFWEVERWSLLWLEPPDHTRIRKLVAAAFTPRSVEAMRVPASQLARELLDPLAERGSFDVIYEFAQPFSIALICEWLGVPVERHRDLLDWSHAMVKMYEFDTTEEQALAANAAAEAFRDFTLELIAERRRYRATISCRGSCRHESTASTCRMPRSCRPSSSS